MKNIQVAVVGAGPAGLAAAIEAAAAGARVTVFDENGLPGGQLFKQIHKFFGSREHQAGTRGFKIGEDLLAETRRLGVDVHLNATVYGLYQHRQLAVMENMASSLYQAGALILATGASENALSFPGSTLPGVMTAGAAQTLINLHRVLPGRRVLMVGSGNVGLIVSYQLMQAGADVVALVEAAPHISGYGVHAAKVRRAGVPILTSHTVREVSGSQEVESATIVELDEGCRPVPGTEKTLEVDTVCLAVGLTPLAEMAWMAGCRFAYIPKLGGHVPLHDGNMETTVKGIYVAGDITGVEEASSAMEEGRLAGVAAAEALGCCPPERAAEKKTAVLERLAALRTGPFGQHRQDAKQELIKARCQA
ncbi:pyridine nucleotide-disulfide oxidoreductase [Clostridiales bacterium PH28_bin88]|nr:pyridine nucleotide-disulfide oxidoreductase [Clostridiales bacterium PH28_bin88]